MSFARRLAHIKEPKLRFGHGQAMEYPRDGLFLFGPVDQAQRIKQINYGIIGTRSALRRFRLWSKEVTGFIEPPNESPHHVCFPGFAEVFGAVWPNDPVEVIDDIEEWEIDSAARIENRHEAVYKTVDIFVSRLEEARRRLEVPIPLWFVVVPEIVYRLCRPKATVPVADRLPQTVTISEKFARSLATTPTLFPEDARQAEIYDYVLDFRRQLKARLLASQTVTQIIREPVLEPAAFTDGLQRPLLPGALDRANLAWNLCTAAYYKVGGLPWRVLNVRDGVCYVGITYKKTSSDAKGSYACCAAQMFLSDGDGVVFRGAMGPWYNSDLKQFHLSTDEAKNLTEMVIQAYRRDHRGAAPRELFLHAKSEFSEEEWLGFQAGCAKGNYAGRSKDQAGERY